MLRRVLLALLLVTTTTQPAAGLDTTDKEPPKVDSMRVLRVPDSTASPFVIVEFQTSDDKNWVSGGIRLSLGFEAPTDLVPTCNTAGAYASHGFVVELPGLRSTASGRNQQTFWSVFTVDPILPALPNGCPDWRTEAAQTVWVEVNLTDEAQRNLTVYGFKSAARLSGLETNADVLDLRRALTAAIAIAPTGRSCVDAMEWSGNLGTLVSAKTEQLQAIASATAADMATLRTTTPPAKFDNEYQQLLQTNELLQKEINYRNVQLNPTLPGVAALPTCSLDGRFRYEVPPYVDLGMSQIFLVFQPKLRQYVNLLTGYQRQQALRKPQLTCVKGKLTKKVTGSKCPSGYRLKK